MKKRILAWLLAGCMLAGVTAEPLNGIRVSAAVTQTKPESVTENQENASEIPVEAEVPETEPNSDATRKTEPQKI